MTVVEWTLAGVFAALGMRSLIYWLRRPLATRSFREHLLYALWVTGRAGMWFAVAGVFVISASITAEERGGLKGRAFLDEFGRYRWYILVPLALSMMQLVAGIALGRSGGED